MTTLFHRHVGERGVVLTIAVESWEERVTTDEAVCSSRVEVGTARWEGESMAVSGLWDGEDGLDRVGGGRGDRRSSVQRASLLDGGEVV